MDNQGTIEENTSGGVLYTNYDAFVNWSGGTFGTLTGGTWKISNGGIMVLNGENITTNAATIGLSGANSHLESYHDFYYSDYTDALAGLMVNTSAGNLQILSGAILDVEGQGGLSNAGSVTIGSGATISLGTADYTQSAGTTTVDGNLIAANVDLNGGTLNGTGTIQANVTNAGTMFPGTPPPPLR